MDVHPRIAAWPPRGFTVHSWLKSLCPLCSFRFNQASAMNTTAPIHVGAVLFEGFELLDFYGPLEMFGLLESAARITIVAEKAGAVRSSCGSCGMAEATMAGSGGFNVLLIPGGIGTRKGNRQSTLSGRAEAAGGSVRAGGDRMHGQLPAGEDGIARWPQSHVEQAGVSTRCQSCAKGELDCESALGGGLGNISRRRASVPGWTWPWP